MLAWLTAASPNAPPATRSSPRRSCAISPNAGALAGDARLPICCHGDVADVDVCRPRLQATIAARIDRLGPPAKRTLNAAAVIGSRFDADLLATAGDRAPTLDELVKAELIDQVGFTPRVEYAFRHPLIRTVAYESQLKSDRAELHRQLAAAIEQRRPESADENAALIAEHLEAAGDLHAASTGTCAPERG